MATDRAHEAIASTATTTSPPLQRYSFVEIKEAQRVCSDKMMAAALEEVRGSASAQRRWHVVNRGIILPLARVLTGREELYRYLHASVDDFCTMPELAEHLAAAGFTGVASRTVGGWQRDILHLVRASGPSTATDEPAPGCSRTTR